MMAEQRWKNLERTNTHSLLYVGVMFFMLLEIADWMHIETHVGNAIVQCSAWVDSKNFLHCWIIQDWFATLHFFLIFISDTSHGVKNKDALDSVNQDPLLTIKNTTIHAAVKVRWELSVS